MEGLRGSGLVKASWNLPDCLYGFNIVRLSCTELNDVKDICPVVVY